MNITFMELVKYAKMKSVNGYNLDQILKHEGLIRKVEKLKKEDSQLNEVVEKLKKCDFSDKELNRLKDLFESYFGLEVEATDEELIAEEFGVSLDKVDTIKLKSGEEIYRVIDSDNRDIVLQKDHNKKLGDELSEYASVVGFDSNLENNTEGACEYQRINGYNNLEFYTKEEINNRPELLEELSIDQIEKIRVLIKMNNVVFINPKFGLGLGVNHQLIYADYNSSKGTVSVSDSSGKDTDIVDVIEELELYPDPDTIDVAPETDYAELVSTTQLPVIDQSIFEEYSTAEENVAQEKPEELENKVLKKIAESGSDKRGFVGYAILIGIVTVVGILFTVLKFII